MKKKKTLIVIDGMSLVYRAFHAIPSTFANQQGLPTNAVYGFTQTLRKILKDFAPDYVAVAFDVKGPSFRHEMFAEYKAERPPMPDLLSVQIPYVKKVIRAFGIAVLESESFEADDIIASVAKKLSSPEVKTFVVSGDKDMYQLVGENTVILDYTSGREYGAAEVEDRFGVGPAFIRDLIGLAGDTSDNIPGVPGIGFKTAARLLKKHGSLEGVYENIDKVSGEKLRENLKKYRDQAFLSRDLATLHPEVGLSLDLKGFEWSGPDVTGLAGVFKELAFDRLIKEYLPDSGAGEDEGAEVRVVEGAKALGDAQKELMGVDALALALFFSDEVGEGGEAALLRQLVGFSIAIKPSVSFYCPSARGGEGAGGADGGDGGFEFLKKLLEDGGIKKNTDDSKALYLYSRDKGVSPRGLDIDTSLASYLLNPSRADHGIEALVYEFLGRLEKQGALTGKDINAHAIVACRKARNIYEVSEKLKKELDVQKLDPLYRTIELPLSEVLASMECYGIKVDSAILRSLSRELEVDLAELEKSVYLSAGMEFNINSPKQLSEVLFKRLGLKPLKKTKTGFSTDEEVLTRLATEHDVPRLILGFRGLSKMKSTYVDALLGLINPSTGRIHTSFNQTVTSTGRLSSSRPNLQNIPVRGETAARIREAFVAEKGFAFICADYSQIELRIVAHMSEDPSLIESFARGEDVHSRTACQVFGIKDPVDVTPEQRRRAKAINFGIIYGMGPYGLSTELGITVNEAREYIESYFEHYSSVKGFIDRTVEEAANKGYTETLFGRRRYIPELESPYEPTRRFGERLAINTPVQGSAADIIKAAMIRIYEALEKGGLSSRMILQIHDELVLEVASSETEVVAETVRREMEGAVRLKVPVVVNLKFGANWRAVEPF